jgi:hypothetical protein
MRTIKEWLKSHLDENIVAFRLEKWLQIHAGGHPAVYFSLYRMLRTNTARIVTPDTQLVIEGFPRSQFICQEGLRFGAGRELRQNAYRSSSPRSGAGGSGGTMADTHPGGYT